MSCSWIEDVKEEMEEEYKIAMEYKKKTGETKYFYDISGLEYWYVEGDIVRHYTMDEG